MYLENDNIICKYQFGFRTNHSTNSSLTVIIDQVRNACNNGLYTCSVYLDLKKAFDTVNQNILPAKLKHYGFKVSTFDCFKAFICDRFQYTSIDLNKQKSFLMELHKVMYLVFYFLLVP